MKLNSTLLVLFVLIAVASSSAQEVSVDQLKDMMAQASDNLTTYVYTRSAESEILYSNQTIQEKFLAGKETAGKVDLPAQRGWWNATLTDRISGQVLTWEGSLVNGSEHWKENQNWTQFIITDIAQVMEDYNELPSQVALAGFSDMQMAGTEKCGDGDCYKLVGSPIKPLLKELITLQPMASYFPSPFPLPEELQNKSLDIDNTSLLDHSRVTVTAWISKNTSLLRRMDIQSSVMITPQILNIPEPDFEIESRLNESTIYSGFGEPVEIELPPEAQNETYRTVGTDWRWAAFGSARP